MSETQLLWHRCCADKPVKNDRRIQEGISEKLPRLIRLYLYADCKMEAFKRVLTSSAKRKRLFFFAKTMTSSMFFRDRTCPIEKIT